MQELDIYAKLITQVNGNTEDGYLTEVIDDNGKNRTYVSFKVADSYDKLNIDAPEHSTGSPMLDIIESNPSIQLATIHKEYFTAQKSVDEEKKDGFLQVDMICAESEISLLNYAVESNTIFFDVTDQKSSIMLGFTLNGIGYDPDKKENPVANYEDYDWQFVLKSSIEKDNSLKDQVIKTVYDEKKLPYSEDVLTIEENAA